MTRESISSRHTKLRDYLWHTFDFRAFAQRFLRGARYFHATEKSESDYYR